MPGREIWFFDQISEIRGQSFWIYILSRKIQFAFSIILLKDSKFIELNISESEAIKSGIYLIIYAKTIVVCGLKFK